MVVFVIIGIPFPFLRHRLPKIKDYNTTKSALFQIILL